MEKLLSNSKIWCNSLNKNCVYIYNNYIPQSDRKSVSFTIFNNTWTATRNILLNSSDEMHKNNKLVTIFIEEEMHNTLGINMQWLSDWVNKQTEKACLSIYANLYECVWNLTDC